MLGRFIPRDQDFFGLFNELAGQLTTSARLLNELFETPQHLNERVKAIKDAEHRADVLTHEIGARIDASFVTPIDREDIHTLAIRLDDVIDLVDGTARRAQMLQIGTSVRPPAVAMSRILKDAAGHVQHCVAGIKSPKEVRAAALEVKRLEEESDAVYHDATGELFSGKPDPLEVIKWMELFDGLERTIDSCMGVVHSVENISLKNG